MCFQITHRMGSRIWSSLQAVRGEKGEFVVLGPGVLTSTPVAMATDWEEPGRSYCSQGRICQSKKLAGEGRSKSKSPARLVCGRRITAGGRAGIFGWWQSTKAQEKSTLVLHISKWMHWAVLDHPLSCYAIFTWGSDLLGIEIVWMSELCQGMCEPEAGHAKQTQIFRGVAHCTSARRGFIYSQGEGMSV